MEKERLGEPQLAFNWDGGSPDKLCIGATGGYRMEIHVEGLASHAGVSPERGVSAIAIASLAIADLQRHGWHGLIRKGKKRGTSNVGIIRGGEATNVVTDRVYLKAEARSHDPKFREKIVAKIEKAFKSGPRKCGTNRGNAEMSRSKGNWIMKPFDYRTTSRACWRLSEPCNRSATNRCAPWRMAAWIPIGFVCSRHSLGDTRLWSNESAHDERNAGHCRLPVRLPNRPAIGNGERRGIDNLKFQI